MNNQDRCIIEILLDNFDRTICCHYQGDEEPCKKVEDHLAYNCDGKIRNCDLWQFSDEWRGIK